MHQGCSERCRAEFSAAHAFAKDAWALVRLIYQEPRPKEFGYIGHDSAPDQGLLAKESAGD